MSPKTTSLGIKGAKYFLLSLLEANNIAFHDSKESNRV